MLMPSIFGESFVDDFFGTPERYYVRSNNATHLMQTDVRETDENYELSMELPGIKKEDVKCSLKEGNLTVTATTSHDCGEKDENGRYIRRERYSGTCSRSFYVGKDLKQEDIKARFEDGVLKLSFPKAPKKPEVKESQYIAIEG